MGSQYDAIGSKYNVFKTLPAATVELENMKNAVQPLLAGRDKPRVLDLACGAGYYSHKFIEWGAEYVLGIDLSSGMIDAANETLLDCEKPESLRFAVGDAKSLGRIEFEDPFDIVTGAWCLNYASNLQDMRDMFRTISSNLKDDGVFIGLTPHPADDLDVFANMTNDFEKEQPHRWGVTVDYYEKLASGDGWRTEVTGHGDQQISFRNYHLRKEIYEEGARLGGMQGKPRWKQVILPSQAVERWGEAYWDLFFVKGPHMGILIVEK